MEESGRIRGAFHLEAPPDSLCLATRVGAIGGMPELLIPSTALKNPQQGQEIRKTTVIQELNITETVWDLQVQSNGHRKELENP